MSNRSNDRASLCAFTFVDGRRCRTPRRDDHVSDPLGEVETGSTARAASAADVSPN